ncbi:hypothetical protein [Phyllobacterium sophorae]|uniref:hypothetical protein n=1 Tax=Phyllobacterium sophorae TaxID=1520277 RepID=UPI0011B29E20|nr:hypothetical protein [Phyllobacterium sophorae]
MPIQDIQHKPTASSGARVVVEEGNTPVAVDTLSALTVGDFSTTNLTATDITTGTATINGPVNTSKFLTYATATSPRWLVASDNVTESGANAGSGFAIWRYSDAGSFLGTPFYITRSTGKVAFETAPSVGGSDLITAATAASTYLPLAGGTLSGDLKRSGAAGTNRQLIFQTGGVDRWSVLANSIAESGSNAGSNYVITRSNDAGTFIDAPFYILRNTGTVGVTSLLSVDGGQIAFPATQIPSTDVNTLDDYEEGTWTPTLAFGGASVGITYNSRTGSYIKIGRLVTVGLRVTLSNKGSSTGATSISGLPFTVSNSPAATLYAANVTYWAGGAATLNPSGYLVQNSTSLSLVIRAAGTVTTCTNTDFTNTTDLIITATYLASN